MFFLAEYLGMFAVSGLAVSLFLGGWHAPLPWLEIIPSYVWFFAKLAVLLFVFIWIRGTLPRMRVDHVMNFAWKFMMPMALPCILAAAVGAFIAIAVFTLAGALAAACLRKLIHAALCLVVAFLGLAAFYFFLGAEFVGLVQVFVYVGAVAVLIVFTILLTRREDEDAAGFNWAGVIVAAAVFAGLAWTILKTPALSVAAPGIEPLTVKRI